VKLDEAGIRDRHVDALEAALASERARADKAEAEAERLRRVIVDGAPEVERLMRASHHHDADAERARADAYREALEKILDTSPNWMQAGAEGDCVKRMRDIAGAALARGEKGER
jgi:hypothetical protein